MAGKRKGTNDERYLWGEMLRAIQEIKPKYVIAENVFGITNIDGGLVFEQVCLDLEAEGYEVQPFIIPAVSKNAPHRRDRCWFVAYSKSNGLNQCNCNNEINTSQGGFNALGDVNESNGNGNATDTECIRLQVWSETRNISKKKSEAFSKRSKSSISIKTNGSRYPKQQWENFPTQSPICGGDDGLPTKLDGITFSKWRAESIKGYGNAIVPQVALQIFKAIEAYELQTH
jgi:DNA (cytosine-5)-methyltransferase 1